MNLRSTMIAHLRLPLLLLLVVACARPAIGQLPITREPDDGGPALRVLHSPVVFDTSGGRVQGVVHFRYRNRGPGVAAISEGCGPAQPRLERWDGSTWKRVHATTELLCLAPPALVPVGGVNRDSIVVRATPRGGRPSLEAPESFQLPVEGRYRLVWGIHDAVKLDQPGVAPDNVGPLRAPAERTSNEFVVAAGAAP